MKRIQQVSCFILCLCFGQLASAQDFSKPLAIPDLLNHVMAFSPKLATDSSAIQISESLLKETNANALPNLRLSYQADLGSNNNVAGPYMAFGIVPSNSRGVRTTSNMQASLSNLGIVSLDWEIYNFGAYQAANNAARATLDAERSRYAQSRFQLKAQALDDYLSLMKIQDLLEIQRNNITRNGQISRSIGSLARSGIRPGVDTSIANAELSKSRLNYIELENTYKKVQLNLAAISGIAKDSIVADTSLLDKLRLLEISLSVNLTDSSSHPLLDFYRKSYQASMEKESLVKKSYNPKISLQATAWSRGSSIDANDTFNHLSTGLEWQRQNYFVGLGISYNLFDLKRRQLKLRTQKANSTYNLKNLQQERQLLSNAALQADVELQTAHKRLTEIPRQLQAARAGYRQKLSLYKNGLTDIISLDAALNILYRAETDYVSAKYLYSRALFQKAIATNQIDSLLNSLK
ncbi:TolC family protein [Pedobacter soli]|uniref:Outer membrane protein TolC n=1 Tax=Pedobacter soli TaxID=390242 RepID=A0A1G6VGB5_9SPHI|nr:TolC family protein [Pedobacter soli]SDD52077.1 Outer membrane protein TolC [Pedobacter soli]